MAVHDASTEECSMTGVEIFVVSKHLTQEGKQAQCHGFRITGDSAISQHLSAAKQIPQ
jgi:hypothetical protein